MKNHISKGKFIVFEGGEACGKTTQIEILKEKYQDKFLFTREPGGTKIAEEIRKIITLGDADKILPETELALIYAGRIEHYQKFIKPNLSAGKTIICDRFYLSTLVYQGVARGLSKDLIEKMQTLFLEDFKPDITFLFDLDIEIAKKRVENRALKDERYENFGNDFHQKIREAYLEEAKKDPSIKIIDATLPIKKITQTLESIL